VCLYGFSERVETPGVSQRQTVIKEDTGDMNGWVDTRMKGLTHRFLPSRYIEHVNEMTTEN